MGNKVFFFEVSGKIEGEDLDDTTDKLFELLDGSCQFQIDSMREELE